MGRPNCRSINRHPQELITNISPDTCAAPRKLIGRLGRHCAGSRRVNCPACGRKRTADSRLARSAANIHETSYSESALFAFSPRAAAPRRFQWALEGYFERKMGSARELVAVWVNVGRAGESGWEIREWELCAGDMYELAVFSFSHADCGL